MGLQKVVPKAAPRPGKKTCAYGMCKSTQADHSQVPICLDVFKWQHNFIRTFSGAPSHSNLVPGSRSGHWATRERPRYLPPHAPGSCVPEATGRTATLRPSRAKLPRTQDSEPQPRGKSKVGSVKIQKEDATIAVAKLRKW